MKKLFNFILIISFAACTTAKRLEHTGIYTVKSRQGSITQFYEVKGKYNILSDTLKVNEKIIINVIRINTRH